MVYREIKTGQLFFAHSEYAIRAYVYHKGMTVTEIARVSLYRNNLKQVAGGVYEL